ncbi:hypothetical protein [Lacihabitans soyangensis]|uniref:hypothetical protein n=1 Tax=Lacihabitans soyangensis TaxID=869394 RepID=UPI0020CFC802|nr:hypothetical protein [Lacihabitans soyangensis]
MKTIILAIFIFIQLYISSAQKTKPFKAIAFYTAKNDPANISFVQEANRWFPEVVEF